MGCTLATMGHGDDAWDPGDTHMGYPRDPMLQACTWVLAMYKGMQGVYSMRTVVYAHTTVRMEGCMGYSHVLLGCMEE